MVKRGRHPEDVREVAGEHRKKYSGDERQHGRGLHVLGQRSAPEVQGKESGVDRGREPAAHRAEYGTPHRDGGGYQDREPHQLL